MRKLLIFTIIASLLLCLAACGKGYGDTVAFEATVTQVGASRITVTTHDEAVSFTEANVSFAEGTKISFTVADLKDFSPSTEKGTLICNPPYGERLLDFEQCKKIYATMGRVFEKKHGWSYGIISPDEEFEASFGRKADKRRKLYNGMIKCQFYMYFK